MDIWRKSLSMSFVGLTLRTGVTKAYLYTDGYLHWIILAQIILWTTGASSSQYRLSTHPGIMSDPVAFLRFSCFKAALTRSIESVGGFLLLNWLLYFFKTWNYCFRKVWLRFSKYVLKYFSCICSAVRDYLSLLLQTQPTEKLICATSLSL